VADGWIRVRWCSGEYEERRKSDGMLGGMYEEYRQAMYRHHGGHVPCAPQSRGFKAILHIRTVEPVTTLLPFETVAPSRPAALFS
jgi:hypothetical protein